MKEKKEETVNLGGIAFRFDRGAYERLAEYLGQLKKVYGRTPEESAEIIGDIEARIAELILSDKRYDAEKIVTLPVIGPVIEQMGMPEFPADSGSGRVEQADAAAAPEEPKQKIPKRLFRNRQEGKIGGVLSGFGAYLGIDATKLRLLFILLLMLAAFRDAGLKILSLPWDFRIFSPDISFFALLIFIYLILWIVIPAAKTPRQKLEMKGKKVTADTIGEGFRDEMESRTDNPRSGKTASLLVDLLYVMGKLLKFILLVFASLIGIGIVSILLFTIVMAGVVLTGGLYKGMVEIYDVGPYPLVVIVALCAAIAPMLLFCYLLFNVIFNKKTSRKVAIPLVALWIVSWVAGGVLGGRMLQIEREKDRATACYRIPVPQDTLYLRAIETEPFQYESGPYATRICRKSRMDIVFVEPEETDGGVELIHTREISGRSKQDVRRQMEGIPTGYVQDGDTLRIHTYIVSNREHPRRRKNSYYILKVPKGKVLGVGDEVDRNCRMKEGLIVNGGKWGGYYVYGTEPEEVRHRYFER